MDKNTLQWFKDRVGKKVYRTKSTCNCMVCYDVFMNGLYIADEFHANYLFDCQNELDLYYFDQKQHIIDIMKADEEDGLYNQNKSNGE